jgi:hypothetical protein
VKVNIALFGLPFEKPEIVEKFQGTETELKLRLLSLQSGFCQNEKPKIRTISNNGKKYFEAYSGSDYSYVARIS